MDADKENNRWISFVGDCKAVDSYLNSKPGIGWLLPKFVNAFLRGLSQVLFANNPFSGLLLFLALLYVDLVIGMATVLGGTLSIITATIMKQDPGTIQAGLTTYNGILVGCVTASLWGPIYNEPLSPKIWGFIVAGSIISVFINSACANIMSSFKVQLPSLTLPFNIIILLMFTCLMPPPSAVFPRDNNGSNTSLTDVQQKNNMTGEAAMLGLGEQIPNLTTFAGVNIFSGGRNEVRAIRNVEGEDNESQFLSDDEGIEHEIPVDFNKVFIGSVMSMGQVFAVENLFASILMYVAILVYSPLLCAMSFLGGLIGTLAGLLFASSESSYVTVYTGIWGYNTILSASSVGGFFFAINFHSFWTAIANVLFTVLIQQGLAIAFRDLRLPFFTLPFILSTFMFLSVTSVGNQLYRVKNISYPEMHRFDYLESQRNKSLNSNVQETQETKELVLQSVKVVGESGSGNPRAT